MTFYTLVLWFYAVMVSLVFGASVRLRNIGGASLVEPKAARILPRVRRNAGQSDEYPGVLGPWSMPMPTRASDSAPSRSPTH
jgi:hypothetical protein